MQKMIIIGLVGEKGSGKETVGQLIVKLLPENKVSHIKFSDLLKETLTLWSLPHSRENLQDLAIIMDQQFGEGTLANAMYERIKKLDADVVILDGVRWDADIALLNRFRKHYLIYVTADLEIRFRRISKRIEKVGEGRDFQQFMNEEQKPNEVNIAKFGATADVTIENNGDLEELRQKVATVVTLLV